MRWVGHLTRIPSHTLVALPPQAASNPTPAYALLQVEAWFTRLDCLVVGPGLGRDSLLLDTARSIIQRARKTGLPLILDGDSLFLVAREPDLVLGEQRSKKAGQAGDRST
jgi:ATP-dependent NAD(P)H-hydrate dehydratase